MNSEDQDPSSHLESHPQSLTRRRLLQNSACIAAASIFPRLAAAAANDVSPVMERLSSYMSEARNRVGIAGIVAPRLVECALGLFVLVRLQVSQAQLDKGLGQITDFR